MTNKTVILLCNENNYPSPLLISTLKEAGVSTVTVRSNGITAEFEQIHPLAIVHEVNPGARVSDLHALVVASSSSWPGVPLVASRAVPAGQIPEDQQSPDDVTLKRLGFRLVAEDAAQVPFVLQKLEASIPHELFPAEEEDDPGSLVFEELPKTLNSAQLRLAYNLVSSLHMANEQKQAAQFAIEGVSNLVSADRWALFQNSDTGDKSQLEPVAVMGELSNGQLTHNEEWMQGVSEEKEVVRTLSSQVARASVENAQIIKKAENGLKIIALPLIRGGRVLGVIEGIRETSDTRSFTKSESILLSSLALPLACAISNAGRIAEAERLSLTDDLTKLYNGRYLRQYLTSEIRRARRYNSMVSVLFLDLDDFKNINDKYGHLVGSHLLMEVAAVILTSVRDTDVVARYGGDEFVVVLPESDIVQSGRVAERVRDRISKHVFTGGRRLKLSVTASFGVATFPHHCSSPQQLVARADTAMYEAKAARKNCVRLASEAPVEEEVPNVIY